ncbi:hypothetical protein [Paraburkholderia phenazinium]|uniref:HEPN domain-containing protein n=1 Tax=Paraburkholderia phenazinium TaxID=60549 RepID=A0A1N6HSW2_9BURK|nr:hypothetical protein [Paraburkholderia phenazinium]SIO22739.1 hypothetical protein SAMN05444168_3572 [Paraburkholderia phenazinium]
MSITINDLVTLAGQLANGATEQEWRSAASRAYYADFHKALEVADGCLPVYNVVMGEHERLTERLKKQGNKGKSLAYVLIDHKKVRTRADYKLTKAFTQADATDLIALCPAFFQQADDFYNFVTAQSGTGP